MRPADVIIRKVDVIMRPGSCIRRMYAIVHPAVILLCPADSISNATQKWKYSTILCSAVPLKKVVESHEKATQAGKEVVLSDGCGELQFGNHSLKFF